MTPAKMNSTQTFKQDFFCGLATSAMCATLTNGLYHRQYCQVTKYPFRLRDCGRGFIPNFNSFLGCLLVANAAKGAMTRFMVKHENPLTDRTKIAIGALSGCASAFGVVTGEYLAIKDNRNGRGFFKNVKAAYKKEGIRSLWRGLTPTFFRNFMTVGVALGGGEVAKRRIKRKYRMNDALATGAASAALGMTASVLTQPLQVVKIQFQSQKQLKLKMIPYEIFRKEGFHGFFKGGSSRIIVNMVVVASDILVNEKIRRFTKKVL